MGTNCGFSARQSDNATSNTSVNEKTKEAKLNFVIIILVYHVKEHCFWIKDQIHKEPIYKIDVTWIQISEC